MSIGLTARHFFRLMVDLHQEVPGENQCYILEQHAASHLAAYTVFAISINYSALVTFSTPLVIKCVEACVQSIDAL